MQNACGWKFLIRIRLSDAPSNSCPCLQCARKPYHRAVRGLRKVDEVDFGFDLQCRLCGLRLNKLAKGQPKGLRADDLFANFLDQQYGEMVSYKN